MYPLKTVMTGVSGERLMYESLTKTRQCLGSGEFEAVQLGESVQPGGEPPPRVALEAQLGRAVPRRTP